ncbi:MAG: helix-turn-helix transcriptional regulator [Cyclobacteriaceae bacterium]|nr:helix-turn-helix transcriptional regulator [Cyclobacteriaceae bacterium]
MKYLAENIRYLRKKFGWSQEKLAEILGLNRGNIASYEKGTAEPRLENLIKIMELFKVEIKDLVEIDLAGMENLGQEIEDLKRFHGTEEKEKYDIRKARLLKRLIVKDEQIKFFVRHSDEMQKILEGFKTFHQFKMKNGHRLSDDVKKISDEYEKLLELMESMINTNRNLINYLDEKGHEVAERDHG